jgi:hypothetical protein
VDPEAIRRILAAVTRTLGDSVTFTAALAGLRSHFPRARLVGLFHRAFAELYRGDPQPDAVIPYHGKYKRARETLPALRGARAGRECSRRPAPAEPPAVLEQIGWLLANGSGVAHFAYATGTPA